jgi:hypothetical protein
LSFGKVARKALSLLLGGKLGRTKVASAELDVEHALHGGEHLLVRRSGTALKLGDDVLCGVALCGQVLLGHLGLHLLTGSSNDITDFLADCVGLDDVVGAVDLGQTLTLTTAGRVGRSELLLGANDTTLSLSGVESTLATDDSLTLSGARSTDTATNLGDLIPVVGHCDDCAEGVFVEVRWLLSLVDGVDAFAA